MLRVTDVAANRQRRAATAGPDLEPAGRRMLKGFDDPVAVASLTLD